MPGGFTSNYVFEFHKDGRARMQLLVSTPPDEAIDLILCEKPALAQDYF